MRESLQLPFSFSAQLNLRIISFDRTVIESQFQREAINSRESIPTSLREMTDTEENGKLQLRNEQRQTRLVFTLWGRLVVTG